MGLDFSFILYFIYAISIFYITLIFMQIFYIIALKKLFDTIKTEFSLKKTWTVWLAFIPILGNIWIFYLVFQAKTGTEKTLSFYKSQKKSNSGFYWFFISIFFGYLIFFLTEFPDLLILSIFMQGICFIIHVIKVFYARKLILKAMHNFSNLNKIK